MDTFIKMIKSNALRLAWVVALVSMIGSLYFSEVAQYAPCLLCWYQRIALYPLVVILMVGIVKRDTMVTAYALPLAVIGGLISFYHNLLYYNILPESEATCRLGVSCTTKYVEWFGFLTIPLMALLGFAILVGLLLIARQSPQK